MRLLAAVALTTAFALPTAAQDGRELDNPRGTSVRPLMSVVDPIIRMVEERNMEIVRMEYDIVSSQKESFRTLSSDWEYLIAAAGDYRIADLDLALYREVNGQWVEVASDLRPQKAATVTFRPPENGQYRVIVRATRFNEGFTVGRYALLFMHE